MFFVHLRLADRNRDLPTVGTQESSMDGLGKEKKLLRREQPNLKVGRGKKNASYLEGGGVESGQSWLLHCPASPARAYAFFSMSLGEQERESQHVGVKRQQCHMLR